MKIRYDELTSDDISFAFEPNNEKEFNNIKIFMDTVLKKFPYEEFRVKDDYGSSWEQKIVTFVFENELEMEEGDEIDDIIAEYNKQQ